MLVIVLIIKAAIIGTFNEKGAGTFWNVVMKLPLQGNPIVCWKFCHVLHKVLREGHPHVRVIFFSKLINLSLMADNFNFFMYLYLGYSRFSEIQN